MILSALKKLPFYRRYTTSQNNEWWKNRKIDFHAEIRTADHPHRFVISNVLRQINWMSLIEIGCGAGANLANIIKTIPGRQIGGVDINPDAIAFANQAFTGGHFKVGSGDDVMMSDKSTDIVLSDMTLIYIGPLKIKKYLNEMKRICRNNLILHEFHEASWWRRWKLRIFSGRHSYDYKKLLGELGFYDITVHKMPVFEEDHEQRFRHLIIARAPKR